MKKFILILLLLSSCAARKVDVNKTDVVAKVDSTAVVKQEVVTTQDNHVSVSTDTDELEICPLIDTIPMVVNGVTYKNAKLSYRKTKKVLVDTTKIKVAEKSSIKVSVKKDTKLKAVEKKIDKKPSYINYLWWLLIILLISTGYYTYKKINRTLF
jgi:hypothetical protein